MTTGPNHLSRRSAATCQDELQTILRGIGEVNAVFFYGRRLSVRWVSECARAGAAGMRSEGARISQEIPAVRIHAVACESGRVPSHPPVVSRIPTVVFSSCGHLSSK